MKRFLWNSIGTITGVLTFIVVKAISGNSAVAFLFGAALFLAAETGRLMAFIDVRSKEKLKASRFQLAFGVARPATGDEMTATQPAVVRGLIERQRILDDIDEKRNAIVQKWLKSSLQTPEGVNQRIMLQGEYDKTVNNYREAQKQAIEMCEVARDVGFRDEVRAFGYPRVTIRCSPHDSLLHSADQSAQQVAATAIIVMS